LGNQKYCFPKIYGNFAFPFFKVYLKLLFNIDKMKKFSVSIICFFVLFVSVFGQSRKSSLKAHYKQMYKNEELVSGSIEKLIKNLENENSLEIENSQISAIMYLSNSIRKGI